jgi:RNA polymerase sigma-70 factor (sigma-E family)
VQVPDLAIPAAGQPILTPRRLSIVDTLDTGPDAPGRQLGRTREDAACAVTALYRDHAVSMIRIALLMLGDRAAAEDVVQDAFFGLFRRWHGLIDEGRAEAYIRSAVLNGCRDAVKRRDRRNRRDLLAAFDLGELPSAEAAALISEDRRRILAGLRLLPGRQREALVCRYYLELSEEETASAMGVSRGTVKSTTSRAIAALGRLLREGLC